MWAGERAGKGVRRWLRFAPPVALMVLLSGLSMVPARADEDASVAGRLLAWIPAEVQNLVHVPTYGLLAWLWCGALRAGPGRRWSLLTAAMVPLAHGLMDEWLQRSVPGRYSSAGDVLLDALGISLGIGWYRFRARARRPARS